MGKSRENTLLIICTKRTQDQLPCAPTARTRSPAHRWKSTRESKGSGTEQQRKNRRKQRDDPALGLHGCTNGAHAPRDWSDAMSDGDPSVAVLQRGPRTALLSHVCESSVQGRGDTRRDPGNVLSAPFCAADQQHAKESLDTARVSHLATLQKLCPQRL